MQSVQLYMQQPMRQPSQQPYSVHMCNIVRKAQTHQKDQVNEALLDKCCTLDATLQVRIFKDLPCMRVYVCACQWALNDLEYWGPILRCDASVAYGVPWPSSPRSALPAMSSAQSTLIHHPRQPAQSSALNVQAINSKIGIICNERRTEPLQRSLQAADLGRLRRRLDQIKDSCNSSAFASPVLALPVRALAVAMCETLCMPTGN
eukprot:scaffold248168_cov21-Tisochrysis_lutea.AAC.2